VTALYFSIFGLWAYLRFGRTTERDSAMTSAEDQPTSRGGRTQDGTKRDPTWRQTALADSHCGAGCTIADLLTEFSIFWLGLTILGSELYASFLWDFIAAWSIGILFQYFTIKPMRDRTVLRGIWAAAKADTLSILAFQVGMYAWMALVYFKLFPNPHLHPKAAGYWLMMQVAMICGFATAFPVNRQLIKMRWKEAMG
jgi:hypothetical protein